MCLIAKAAWKKQRKAGNITIPDFKLYYKAVLIKTVWYWHKNRPPYQWNRVENPDMNPQVYGQLIFYKAGKSICWKKVSSTNGVGKTRQLHAKERRLITFLHHRQKKLKVE